MTMIEVWEALKALYKGCTTMILVNLSQQLQLMCCTEDENICEHFDKLANLHKQLGTMGKSIVASTEMSGMTVSPAVITKLATDEFNHCTLQNQKGQDKAFAAKSQKKKGKWGK
jgi:hypothetical protein